VTNLESLLSRATNRAKENPKFAAALEARLTELLNNRRPGEWIAGDGPCDCSAREGKLFHSATCSSMKPPPLEPRAERQGVTFGCVGCGAVVTLEFTDASKKSINIMPMNGWIAGASGCYCPRCAAENRPAEPT